jgi:DNA repair photolyase
LTLNPYTGCDHACVYCYASSYIPKFFQCRPKKDLISKLKREAAKLKGELISIANSSDPYPNVEIKKGLTRQCLEILSQNNCKIQIITKSTIVKRDMDFLKKIPSMVSLTITSIDENVAKILEPGAPRPKERLKIIEMLIERGVPTSARIDPIIPYVNDDQGELIKALACIGVKHVTSSTYKVRPDNWRRFRVAMPETAEKLNPLYFEKGEKMGGYTYLPRDLRIRLMKTIAALAKKNGIEFATCREDLSQLNTATCDGSWLIPHKQR